MNPKRAKFKDMFDSKEFQNPVGEYFEIMFDTSNEGSWEISQEWADEKEYRGFDERPNIMTGRMKSALSRPIDESFSQEYALRDSTEKQMKWGAKLEAFENQYPQYPAVKNPFAFMTDSFTMDIGEIAALYLLELQKKAWVHV